MRAEVVGRCFSSSECCERRWRIMLFVPAKVFVVGGVDKPQVPPGTWGHAFSCHQ